MFEILDQDIFARDSGDWLVNPVNCAGVMGAGLAKEFKHRFPKMYESYADACSLGMLVLGAVHTYHPDKIVNLPTKEHWKEKSSLKSILDGLTALRTLERFEKEKGVTEQVFRLPLLGCGLGGLKSQDVIPVMREILEPGETRFYLCLGAKNARQAK